MCVYALWARKCVHGMRVCACVHMCGGVNVGCVACVSGACMRVACVRACAHVCAVCVCPVQGRPEVPMSVACLPPVCGALHPVSRLSGARVRFSSRRLPDRKPRQARGVPDGGERFLTNTTENDPRVQTDCRKQKRKPGGKAGRAKGTRSRHGRPGRDRAGAIGAVRQTPHGVTHELTPRGRRPRSHGTMAARRSGRWPRGRDPGEPDPGGPLALLSVHSAAAAEARRTAKPRPGRDRRTPGGGMWERSQLFLKLPANLSLFQIKSLFLRRPHGL